LLNLLPAHGACGRRRTRNCGRSLSAYLERDGMRIRMAQDGEEALQSFRQLRPDLVLLDIHLPKVDGVDVLRMIRNDSDVPVIMVTALADDVDKLLALRLGADDYVVKPFNLPRWWPGACRAAPHPGQACAGGRPHTRRTDRDRRGSPVLPSMTMRARPCLWH
jgi:CheY-like chemotaxis protein